MSSTDLHFLVAEDHEFQRGVLVKMLANLGATKVHEASDGNAALAIIRDPSRPVDIIISDLDMPGMDGMEFIRHLAESERRISVIIASSVERKLLASVETMADAFGIELLGVVEKPLTQAKLAPLIERHRLAGAKLEKPSAAGPEFTLEEIVAGLKAKQFEPFYQPKVELASGHIKGAEALARWRHPRFGFIFPEAFIKPLEDGGLIDVLTWTMLEKSAAFCRTWRATGAEVTVSVNLSIKSLAEPQLADRVTQLVRDQKIEPHHMVLEVTESSAATELGKALENLARLRIRGFALSIDDYGTGYSSMQQLTRIAFNELKIDRSFVAGAARNDSARVILQSAVEMAKKLKISAVAEGVETQEEWNLLCNLGCDLAQGYFIARPMEANGFIDWCRNHEPASMMIDRGKLGERTALSRTSGTR